MGDAGGQPRPIVATLWRGLPACLTALGLIAGIAGAVAADDPPAPDAAEAEGVPFAALEERDRLHILIGLARSGRHELAAALLTAHPLTGPHARNRTLFVEGLIAKARGELKAAAGSFRAALAADPNLTLVRAELAHTLYQLDDDTAARHHLELLAGAAPTPELARTFDEFIDAIDARRPWQLNAYLSLAPSTNFTNGTTEKTIEIGGLPFQISDHSRKKSGIGVRGGANASYSLRPGKDLTVVAAAGANFAEYEDRAFDDLIVSQSLTLVRSHAKGNLGLGVVTSQRWAGENEFVWTAGPQLTIKHRLTPRMGLYAKLRHIINRYDEADYRDGTTTSVDIRHSYALSDSAVFYVLAGAERTVTERDHLDYWWAYSGAALYREFTHGITVYAEARIGQKRFDGDFPGLGDPQEDTRIDFSAVVTKRDFELFGLAPQIEYAYTRNYSNSPFADYDAHGANFTLTRAF